MSRTAVLVMVAIAVSIRYVFFRHDPKSRRDTWSETSDGGSSAGYGSASDSNCDGGDGGDGGGDGGD